VFACGAFFVGFDALEGGDLFGHARFVGYGTGKLRVVVGGGFAFGAGFFAQFYGFFHLFDDAGAFFAEFAGGGHSV
jgi:hypothetical protein